MKKTVLVATILILTASLATPATSGVFWRDDGRTLVWVKIKAKPGESRWGACRRVYQRDVHQVRKGRGGTMWCNIEHHRLHDNVRRKRNFNLR